MICLSSELFPIILKIAWLRCVWSYSFVCVVHTLFSREKRLNNLGLFTVGCFLNYHFLIACVHLIHWLITMGSVWSLDLVYIVFPKHGQILWSCGGRKALVFLGFFFFCIHGFEGYPNNFLSNKFFYTHGTMKWNITLKKQLF